MAAVKDSAICLRRQNYSETSQIVTLFGRAWGKVRGLAKGSKRPRSPFGGGIEPLTAGHVVFAPPRGETGLATLTQFDLAEGFTALRSNLAGLHCAQYAAELLAECTEELDPHEALYEAFLGALRSWETGSRPEAVLVEWESTLLREIGLAARFDRCCACGGGLAAERRSYFTSRGGGMLCRECEPAVAEKRCVGPQALAVLQSPSTAPRTPPGAVLEAHELLSYHLRELLGKQPRTLNFLNQLLGSKGSGHGKSRK